MSELTTGKIAEITGGRLEGDPGILIEGLEVLSKAGAGELTMIGQEKYCSQWSSSQAAAALVAEGLEVNTEDGRPVIYVKNTDHATIPLLELLAPPLPTVPPGVHPSAVVDESAELGPGVAIGPLCYVGPGVKLGAGTVLHDRVSIYDDCVIGQGCEFWSGVVIRERCSVGDGCIFHGNVVIGADGFGYRPAPDGQGIVKVPQIGTVEIGRAVEIGAGTTVDRGKFSATRIGDGTKIDNLVQIGHNCQIGRCCIIVAMCGIGGSTTLEDGVTLGGKAALKDHLHLGAGCTIAATASLMNDVPAGETWGGYPAKERSIAVREVLAVGRLPDLMKKLKKWSRESGVSLS